MVAVNRVSVSGSSTRRGLIKGLGGLTGAALAGYVADGGAPESSDRTDRTMESPPEDLADYVEKLRSGEHYQAWKEGNEDPHQVPLSRRDQRGPFHPLITGDSTIPYTHLDENHSRQELEEGDLEEIARRHLLSNDKRAYETNHGITQPMKAVREGDINLQIVYFGRKHSLDEIQDYADRAERIISTNRALPDGADIQSGARVEDPGRDVPRKTNGDIAVGELREEYIQDDGVFATFVFEGLEGTAGYYDSQGEAAVLDGPGGVPHEFSHLLGGVHTLTFHSPTSLNSFKEEGDGLRCDAVDAAFTRAKTDLELDVELTEDHGIGYKVRKTGLAPVDRQAFWLNLESYMRYHGMELPDQVERRYESEGSVETAIHRFEIDGREVELGHYLEDGMIESAGFTGPRVRNMPPELDGLSEVPESWNVTADSQP